MVKEYEIGRQGLENGSPEWRKYRFGIGARAIVLIEPKDPLNVGGVVRLCACFAFDLVLVRARYPKAVRTDVQRAVSKGRVSLLEVDKPDTEAFEDLERMFRNPSGAYCLYACDNWEAQAKPLSSIKAWEREVREDTKRSYQDPQRHPCAFAFGSEDKGLDREWGPFRSWRVEVPTVREPGMCLSLPTAVASVLALATAGALFPSREVVSDGMA